MINDTAQEHRKTRGAFFTPPRIAKFLAEWAIRSHSDRVLEPSCGEAELIIAAGERLRSLSGDRLFLFDQIHGIDIHPASIEVARAALAEKGLDAQLGVDDFFSCEPTIEFDAVVGNPPYIRYQQFSGRARAQSLEAALSQGIRLTGLASSWAAFVIHASKFLNRDGRLALVLPAELLSVNYAAQVRRFLLNRFSSVRLIMFENRVFPGVLEEVILLLAEGAGGAECFQLFQTKDLDGLANVNSLSWTEHLPEKNEKWTPALLSQDNLSIYRALQLNGQFSSLLDWGGTYLGAVTGNNRYFTLTLSEAARLNLPEEDLVRVSPPGSRHLRGLRFTNRVWDRLSSEEARCFLFYPRDRLRPPASEYVMFGERKGVDRAYKCKVRNPWWRVPIVAVPDLFLTYMNHDRPRLITNDARVNILNSVYGVVLKHGRRKLGRELLPIACLNSLTLLGAEIVGRAYGGGLLKLEPREADRLPVPSLELIKQSAEKLRCLRPQLSIALRQNDLSHAVELVDKVILSEGMSVSDEDLNGLRHARARLFERRRARGTKGIVKN